MNLNSLKSENKETNLIKRIVTNWKKSGSAVAMVLISGVLVACDGYENNAVNTPDDNLITNDTEAVETVTSVEEVKENTEEYIGETVTISGEVENVVSLNSFVLEDEENLFDEDEVLVISVENQLEPIVDGENVQVTGEVRRFEITELERDYDLTWDLDIQRELEAEYKDKTVVVADFTRVL
ncbi:hypothetical protein M595_0385 [Lyngbya aestuarii BL J]|uniref:Uncharacterized protein n=1 Tax=Lyngbya aestuarii BL J TaxID=1348334 RepID=U7QQV5_9CYAN|nr:hypothetical protein [Lyngbya aestuarii]ERT09662.1 hypothetical protein M595_0385 [Lyngbya aestuarii BL J]